MVIVLSASHTYSKHLLSFWCVVFGIERGSQKKLKKKKEWGNQRLIVTQRKTSSMTVSVFKPGEDRTEKSSFTI